MNNEENAIYYIQNAGLIVLNPWFAEYFRRLEMLDEKKQFVDEYAEQRAVHLLQYLATGRQETPEHLLVFNKILCGIDVNTPISSSIESVGYTFFRICEVASEKSFREDFSDAPKRFLRAKGINNC